MTNFTDITVLLDRSGSMASIKSAMESAFNEFVQQHRAVPSSRLSLVQFDTNDPHEMVYTAKPIADVPCLDFTPRGGTPLLDALCRTIDATGNRLLNTPASDRPEKVLFVIITDGQENASREFKRKDVNDRITRQSSIYKWQFVYLGANQDAIAEAASFGIAAGQTMTYSASAAGTTNAMRSVVANTMSYATGQTAAVMDFADLQRAEAMATDKPAPAQGTDEPAA